MLAPAPCICHVTLTTGFSQRSRRGEVSGEALALCRRLLEEVQRTGRATLPVALEPHCYLEGMVYRYWARIRVVVEHTMLPLLDLAIAVQFGAGATLWRRLHEETDIPVETDPERPPTEPWCAAALLSAIGLHAEATAWLVNLERGLAWALYLMSEREF